MNLTYCNRREDETLTKCEDFGGLAYECAQIAEKLSGMIDDEKETVSQLNREIESLTDEIESLKSRVNELEEELNNAKENQ